MAYKTLYTVQMYLALSLKIRRLADVDVLTQTQRFASTTSGFGNCPTSSCLEKALFDELAIPVAPYKAVTSLESLQAAVAELGLPIVLKTARGGYDGKGQFVLRQRRSD